MSGTALPFIGTRARRLAAWLAQFFLFRNANYSHPKCQNDNAQELCQRARARHIFSHTGYGLRGFYSVVLVLINFFYNFYRLSP